MNNYKTRSYWAILRGRKISFLLSENWRPKIYHSTNSRCWLLTVRVYI